MIEGLMLCHCCILCFEVMLKIVFCMTEAYSMVRHRTVATNIKSQDLSCLLK